MKKAILMLMALFLIVPSCMFASELSADGYYNNTTSVPSDLSGAEAKTVVSLDLSSTSDDGIIQLYFTSSDPSSVTTVPSDPAKSVSLALKTGDDGAVIADNSGSALYAWWKIVYGGSLDVQLGIQAPLTNQESGASSQTIDWQASWTMAENTTVSSRADAEGQGKETNDGDFEPVGSHAGATKLTTTGSKQIDIKTLDDISKIEGLTAGKYQAYLILRCATK